jgi:hypothetical protein
LHDDEIAKGNALGAFFCFIAHEKVDAMASALKGRHRSRGIKRD